METVIFWGIPTLIAATGVILQVLQVISNRHERRPPSYK